MDGTPNDLGDKLPLSRAERHPEKAHRPDNPIRRKPDWIRVRAPNSPEYAETKRLMRQYGLSPRCARRRPVPNIGECWKQKHATFMIMGETCTRACAFCNVATGKPGALNPHEPANIAEAVGKLGLGHVVVTSVDRDDLDDGGAGHFAAVITALHQPAPNTTVEVLTPDFLRKDGAIATVGGGTAGRVQPQPRDGAAALSDHPARCALLHLAATARRKVKEIDPSMFTKSGLMVGLGETREEILQVMDDLRAADVDFLTVGQYLQPTPKHAPLDRFWTPAEFDELATLARAKGFLMVSASPLTRSSYHAGDDFARLRAARTAQLGR